MAIMVVHKFARYSENLHARHIWGLLQTRRTSVVTATAQTLYLIPIDIPVRLTIDKIGWVNSTVTTGNLKVGIYPDNGDTPDGSALTVVSASIAAAGNTQKQEGTIADTQLTPGLYWLALLPLAGANFSLKGGEQPTEDGGTIQPKSKAIASDTMPATCPTGLSDGYGKPLMFIRVKSVP